MAEMNSNMRKLMFDQLLTLSALSEKSGVTTPVLHRILSGEQAEPKLSTVKKIANSFGLTVSQFIGEV